MSGEFISFARSRSKYCLRFAHRYLPFTALIAVLFLTACSFIPRDSFTARDQSSAMVPGIPGARFWVDGSKEELRAFLRNSTLTAAISITGGFDVLAISGGAYDGAYGAGVINGWTAAGTRPKFAIVTGVSAGALIAPLAFLGPDYDGEISDAFTGGVAQVLGDIGGVFSLLGTPDFRRSSLVDLVDKFVDARLLRAVAIEHAHGRRLFIVTTNLDAQRGVVWDMGAIAASGLPNARELFRDVLVASASIPGVFGPTFIEVEANGRRFREMHVDGGATTQVFILPDVILATGMGIANPKGAPAHIWVIVNNRMTPQFEVVEAGLLPTISRSFSTLIKSSAKQTLFATAEFTGRERFNLTYIDDRFDVWLKNNYGPDVTPGFNTPYMKALFRYGYNKALSGQLWTHEVPLPGSPTRARDIARQ
jgi:Patatin-like phospholipase